jgi:hypothetical protein
MPAQTVLGCQRPYTVLAVSFSNWNFTLSLDPWPSLYFSSWRKVQNEGFTATYEQIEEFQKLQEVEGLNLGNKLSRNQLKFQKHKMNVRLAAQTLSSSVANAVEFLDKSMKLPSFRNRHGTVIFIRTIFISTEFSLPNCNRVPDTPSPVKQGHIGRNVDVNSRLSAVIENKYSYRSTTLHLAS